MTKVRFLPFSEILAAKNPACVPTLCVAEHERTSNLLIQAIFELLRFSPALEIPFDLTRLGFSDRISDAACKLLGSHWPLSLFSDFHQLCLAQAIGTWQGKQVLQNTARYDKGAHYTPASIVDYLVHRSLFRALEDCDDDGGCRLEILDPSCGCGTFLIAALRYVLASTRLRQPGEGIGDLPPLQKALDIIGTSLFGTDIDQYAVEWTRKLLLLSLWDAYRSRPDICSETQGLRIPDLSCNIACVDFLAPPSEASSELPAPFQDGVDLVIGGPPFVRVQQLHKTQAAKIEEYRRRFETARSGQFDLYMLFVEQALHLLKKDGYLGFSVSNTFLRSASGASLRELIGKWAAVLEIVEFEDPKVYPDAATQIALLSLRKTRQPTRCRHVWIKGKANLRRNLEALCQDDPRQSPQLEIRHFPTNVCRSRNWTLRSLEEEEMLSQIQEDHLTLGDLPIQIRQGISTGADDVFLLRSMGQDSNGQQIVEQRKSGRRFRIEAAALRPLVRGRDIKGYARSKPRSVCLSSMTTTAAFFRKSGFALIFRWHINTLSHTNRSWNPESCRKTRLGIPCGRSNPAS
jgi:hypothetical protein